MPRRGRPGFRAAALVIVAAIALVACATDEPVGSAGSTEPPAPTPTVTRYDLNATVWYAGMVLTFASATSVFDPTGGTVTILLQLSNPGTDDRSFDPPIRITAAGQGFDPVHGTELPVVAAGGTADTLLTFDVPGRPSLDGAVIRIGRSEANQALVPFGAGPVQLATLEPVTIAATGTATAGDLVVKLDAAELRWDLPDWADELPLHVAALTITYDAIDRGTFAGGIAFSGDSVALVLPDGSTVSPRRDGRSQSVTLLLPGTTQTGLFSRFEVPADLHGPCTLKILNGSAHGQLAITIPG